MVIQTGLLRTLLYDVIFDLKVPKVYWDLSTERVMTMEFCEGGQVNDKHYMETNTIDVDEVCTKYLFVHPSFLSPPHSYNVPHPSDTDSIKSNCFRNNLTCYLVSMNVRPSECETNSTLFKNVP